MLVSDSSFSASLLGGEAVLRFPYDERLRQLLRAIPGRRWDPVGRAWCIPLGPDQAEALARLRDGEDGERNGVGSIRQLRIGPLPPFEETVTEFVPAQRIVYRITKGSPLRGHVGVMTFTPASGGTRFVYDIRLASPIPGLP